MPRPRALSEPKQSEFCAMVATGCTIEAAARYVCCSVVTIRREARRNPAFHEHLRKSTISAQLSPINTMRQAAISDWRAAAWLLERTDPHRYGKRGALTFSEAEVTDLLGRVCDAIRQETHDKQTFARIKRRVTAIGRSALRQTTKAAPPEYLPLVEHGNPASADASSPEIDCATSSANPANAAAEHATDQNVTNSRPILIRMSDVPPRNSSTFAHTEAT